MADIFGSALVGLLVKKAASFLTGNHEMLRGVKDKLERLEELLIKVQSAVEAAEGRQIANSWLLQWLRRLKDAAYDADDVLDTFEYRILEQRANEGDDKVSSSFVSYSDVAKRMRTAARSLFSCEEDINDLSSVVEKLERIASDVGDFLKLLELDGSSSKPELFSSRRTTSSLLLEEPIGREKEKEDIINLLLQSESGTVGNVSVIPILGIGGVGKTTLAQMVCKDEKVKQHFSLIMWVCVSDIFDVIKITREILEQSHCKYNPGHIKNFNSLQVTLKEKLRSERFLLVLDDVWNENERMVWEKLRAPLLCGKEGSKIIVTSRLGKVAKLMSTIDPIRLEGLPEEEFWSFFKKCAFNIVDPKDYPGLLIIGNKIAKRLKGLPLAAKTLGGLLNDNLNEEHWCSILNSDIWELEQCHDDIIPVLRLSYQHLPVHLQRCFAYCSLFPKDWKFKRNNLIYMWIAEGLVHNVNNENKRMEDIGEEYFNNLVSKAFFQVAENYVKMEQIEVWEVHDLLHDLAESVSKDACYRIDGDETQKIPDSVRHLSVTTTNLAAFTKYSSIFKHLRALNFLFRSKSDLNVVDLHDVLKMLKSIRVLNFVNCRMEVLPISACELMHLRFLYICRTGIKALPDQLCRFYHLEMLILQDLELDGFPGNINKLINLRHLIEVQGKKSWDFLLFGKDEPDKPIVTTISGIGKFTCLQELKVFSVEKMRGFEIGQLKNLNELRGSLRIRNLENVGSKEEATEARLNDKRCLVDLELLWCNSPQNVRYKVDEEVLEGLQPHSNLKELKVVSCNGVQSPSWLMANHHLLNLVKLELYGCRKWKELPPLGQLPSLKILNLRAMHSIKEIGGRFFGSGFVKGFPSLQELRLYDFPELKEWCAVEDHQGFPGLLSLAIMDCSKLMALPSIPPTLKYFSIKRVGITLLPTFQKPMCSSSALLSSLSSSSLLSGLTIMNCPNLKNVDEWFEKERERLSHLKSLGINSCPRIFLLPPSLRELWITDSGIQDVELSKYLQCDLSSLNKLLIIRCPHITTFPSADVLQPFTKLSYLSISDCGELRSIGGLQSLDSLRYLTVLRCPKISSLAIDQVEDEVGFTSVTDLVIDSPILIKVLLNRRGLTSLRFLRVEGANELTAFTTDMEEAFQHLTSLDYLRFENCNSLQCLPTCLKNLSCKFFSIKNCTSIKSLPCKKMLPSRLESLYVEKCHPALRERYREGGPDRHTIAHIPQIHICD